MNEKILKLVEDKEFVEKIKKCEKAEEFVETLAAYGVELSGTDPEIAFAQFKTGASESNNAESAELTEADLTAVSGGEFRGVFYWIGYAVGKLVKKKTGICTY